MVALEHGPYQHALAAFGRRIRPTAIVVLSAHGGSATKVSVSSAERHEAVHDFGGFPPALYALRYSPPGSPELAQRIVGLLSANDSPSELIDHRGLDHGAWIPLRLMYPEADIRVVQLSVPLQLSPPQLYEIGKSLMGLRSENILILGSGGIVHNLRIFRGGPIDQPVEPWAREFDEWFATTLEQRDLDSLLHYRERARHVELAVPTFEHFAPVFPVLGAGSPWEKIETIFAGFQYGTMSMRSFAIA
jgi:4,5-DOPA dioxygenase extradiol